MKRIKEKILTNTEKFLSNLLYKVRRQIALPLVNANLSLVDLTPNDNAENCETYFEAITQALKNPKIKNIALTGPYGSGKSSIIKSFEKENKDNYRFLNISLASFKEKNGYIPNEDEIEKQNRQIERSIIQQLLYGKDADILTHSRFKRIQIPDTKSALFHSILFTLWVFAALATYLMYPFNLKSIPLGSENLTSILLLITYLIAIPTLLIYDFLKAKNNFSFKKISLKNMELEAGGSDENSILNRHLDEIIYFFQVTNYDLVVIEDLDRFGSPEIFVKLREINKLVNDNNRTNGNTKFLYALKDDMFAHKNRAKFFDIIIPVIPIISPSNSLDKILNTRLHNTSQKKYEKIKKSGFLREVSHYLDDMRLVHNIFNEFDIYYDKLKINDTEPVKLLALIIYKNIYPNDFEGLQQGKGALAKLCLEKTELIAAKRDNLANELEQIKLEINNSDKEELTNIKELISLYLYQLCISNNGATGYIDANSNNLIQFNDISTEKEFEYIIKNSQNMWLQSESGRIRLRKDFPAIEKEVDPSKTFSQRKLDIKNKATNHRQQLNIRISNIEKEIARLPHLKLSELLIDNREKLDETCKLEDENQKKWLKECSLFKYLVLDGHLDENYYLYSSNFYEGRKTINDQNFITTVRSHNQPSPTQPIDNPNEVCAELRDSDFSQSYILNVNLIDHLLENNISEKLNKVITFISEHLSGSEEFFNAYFITSKYTKNLVQLLSSRYPSYAGDVINQGLNEEHLRQILIHVDKRSIRLKMNTGEIITRWLGKNLTSIIAKDFSNEVELSIIKDLNVKVEDISLIEDFPKWYSFIEENFLYEINTTNIRSVLSKYNNTFEIEKSNYTAISNSDANNLKSYIESNIAYYFENVLGFIDTNTQESEESVIKLLNNKNLPDTHKSQLIESQNVRIQDIKTVPKNYWMILAQEKKIMATWENFSQLWLENVGENEVLIELFNEEYYADGLSKASWVKTISDDTRKKICVAILNAEKITNKNYKLLTSNLYYKYINFPKGPSLEKLRILVENEVVSLNKDSYAFAKEFDFLTQFIARNIDAFMSKVGEYDLDRDTVKKLILSDIPTQHKAELVYLLDYSDFDNKLVPELSKVFLEKNLNLNTIDAAFLQWISCSTGNLETALKLIITFIEFLNENETFEIFKNLGEPYSSISQYGKRPKIDNSVSNAKLADLLKRKKFVSSWSVKGSKIQIITKKNPLKYK